MQGGLSLPSHRSTCSLIACGLTVAVVLWSPVDRAEANLVFLRTTEDSEVFVRNPRLYEAVDDPSRPRTLYVERRPALSISLIEIKSVIVESDPAAASVEEVLKEDYRRRAEESKEQRNDRKARTVNEDYYRVTFHVGERAARKVRDFVRRYNGKLFDLRLNGRRVGIIVLVGPMEGSAFTVPIREKGRQHVKVLLSPIRERVVWK